MAIEYTSNEDPRKIKAARFLAVQVKAIKASMARPELAAKLDDMIEWAEDVASLCEERGRCTDAQMTALENIIKVARRWVHSEDA